MVEARCIVAVLVVVGGCSSKAPAVTSGPSDSSDVQSGTPESMLPDSPSTGDGATEATTNAYVRATFDSHAASVVQASCAPGKLRLTLDGVLFDFDHDNLQPGGDDVLAQVKKASADAYPSAHIVVEGHTDNVGTDAHNDDLSTRRANTVVGWMEAHGVAASRLAAKGYGKRWPRVPNTTDANRAKNRRVELIVLDQTAATACKNAVDPGAGELANGPASEHETSGRPDGSGHVTGTAPPPDNPATPVASASITTTTRTRRITCAFRSIRAGSHQTRRRWAI